MSKTCVNPIKLARELGFSIINSAEYNSMKRTEEELINNEVTLNLLKSIGVVESLNDNSVKLNIDTISIKEIESSVDKNTIIQKYLEAKKNYDNLIKNILNIIEYITEETKFNSSNNGRCGKCNSNCTGCKK